jgi:hypothetical protein
VTGAAVIRIIPAVVLVAVGSAVRMTPSCAQMATTAGTTSVASENQLPTQCAVGEKGWQGQKGVREIVLGEEC